MISKAIVKHIFQYLSSPNYGSFFNQKYLISKEISIELDDNEILNKKVWGMTGIVNNSIMKMLLTNVSIDADCAEYIGIFQLDDLSIFAIKYCEPDDSNNKAFFLHNGEAWVETSNLVLAKLLVGIEQIKELLIDYKPIDDYKELYQYLISFLNYDQAL